MTENPNGTFTFNKDGSVDLPVEGKPIRFVKESDLLAVKGGAESKQKEWDTEKTTLSNQLTEVSKLRDETHQKFLQAQAEKEQLAEKYKDYDTWKSKVGEQEKSLKDIQDTLKKHQEELMSRVKSGLIASGVKEESLKDKTLDQLRNLEEAAKLFGAGKQGKPASYDRGTGGKESGAETAFDRAKRIIAAQEERQNVRAKASSEGLTK